MTNFQIFHEMISKFQLNIDPQMLYKEASHEFLLKPFKIRKISFKKIAINYAQLAKKYADDGIQQWQEEWRKNQRKLFIQFLICFCNLRKTSPNIMVQSQWNDLSLIFFRKNPLFLKFQGISVLKNEQKMIWDQKHDELITSQIKICGQGNWNEVSKKVFFSTNCITYISPKHIRERWYNHLSEYINRGQWSIEEDLMILEHVYQKNKHWCEIVKEMEHSRTQHMIKNRYKFLIKVDSSSRSIKELKKVNAVITKIKRKLQNLSCISKDLTKGSKLSRQFRNSVINQNLITFNNQKRLEKINLNQKNLQKLSCLQQKQGNVSLNQKRLVVPNNFYFPGNDFRFTTQFPFQNSSIPQAYCYTTEANSVSLIPIDLGSQVFPNFQQFGQNQQSCFIQSSHLCQSIKMQPCIFPNTQSFIHFSHVNLFTL